MWIQKVFVFIVLCIESRKSYEVESARFERSSKDSDLVTVANDLARLSRIINAIALQAGAIRKTVQIREVITELLKANNESFSRVVQNDLTGYRDDLKHLKEKLTKLSSDTGLSSSFLEDIWDTNNILEKAIKSSNISTAGITQPLNEFFAYIETVNLHVCNKSIVQNVLDFHSLSNNKNKLSGTDTSIANLKANTAKLTNCIENFKTYKEGTKKEFDSKYEAFHSLISVRESIENFNKRFSELGEFAKPVGKVKKASVMFENSMKQYDKRTVGAILERGISHLDTIAETKNAPAHSLTAGFVEVKDLNKVSDDLKSEWFRTKISKKKSTEKLEKSLEGFIQFGKKMEELEAKWLAFKNKFKKSRSFLYVTATELSATEKLDVIDDSALTEYETIINQCIVGRQLDQKYLLQDFDQHKGEFTNMKTLVDNIGKWADKMVSTIDTDIVKHFLDHLKDCSLSGRVEESLDTIRSIAGYDSFHKFIGMFKELKQYQDQIPMVFKKPTDKAKTAILDSVTIMKDSHSVVFSKCLKKNKINTAELSRAIQKIRPMLKTDHFDPTDELFQSFLDMREKLVEVEGYVTKMSQKTSSSEDNPVLKLERSKEVSISFSRGVSMLMEMAEAYQKQEDLLKAKSYNSGVVKIIQTNTHDFVRCFFKNPAERIDKLLQDLKQLNEFAGTLKNEDFLKMKQIFLKAKTVQGFPEVFGHVYSQLEHQGLTDKSQLENMKNAKELSSLDLDFSSHRGYFPAASLSVGNIKTYFDDIFGLVDKKKRMENAFALVFGVSFAIFIVIVVIAVVGYGLTENGKERYRKLYFYYFPKPKEFEKRWRYSLFMDRVDGKNALLDGVREIHKEHVLKAVKRGVYINVYANFPPELGNTALHLATKRAYPEIVDILIRYGADRTLLNAQNKTPEQMIPSDYRENQKEKIARFEQVEKIYKKYGKKKFRTQVPDLFPESSFHIYIDGKTDDDLTIAFTEKFQAICSEEVLPTTTHCVVKTDKNGLLETDDLKLLFWIFSGVIIVKDTWMTECLKNDDIIHHDADYLVEKVKFGGVVYDTVTQWTMAMAKGTMPYLYGVYVAVVVVGYENIGLLSNMVALHGGVVLDKFPEKEEYNLGSRPYLHVNTSPLFIIHDGKVNLDHYKNDVDKMYTLFTEQEFLHFMLKRDIQVNQNPNPPPVAIDGMID